MKLEALRQKVWETNVALPKTGLVMWTSGNASGRDPETNLVVIKPSGVNFDDMTPEDLVVVDLDGNVVEGSLRPSVDTGSHLYVYRHRDDIHGIVHTHSRFATTFAIRGESIPVHTTTAAALFGGVIPVSDFATIGEEDIGREIVEKIGEGQVILMRNHGVFTVGKDLGEALKNAVYVEETAEVVYYARLLGPIDSLSDKDIRDAREMYLTSYGQK